MAMTPEEFRDAMYEIIKKNISYKYGYDAEYGHVDMDNLMCKLLRDLGYGEGVSIFETTDKWYA